MAAGEVLKVKERTIQNAYVNLRVALEDLPDEVLLLAAAEPKPESESEQG